MGLSFQVWEFWSTTYTIGIEKEEIFAKELSIKEFLREADPPVMSGQVGFCKASRTAWEEKEI